MLICIKTDLLSGAGSSVELIPKMSASGVYKQNSNNSTKMHKYTYISWAISFPERRKTGVQ